MSAPEKDDVTGIETTGHEWDGVKELNNPLPKWWVSLFYATIVFSVIWTIAFPAWPLITEHTKGVLGYSTRAEVAEEIAKVKDAQSVWRDRIAAASFDEILGDEELSRFATRAGAAAYAVNCSQCHGSGAAGGTGYPNLNDDAWIWGGDIQAIHDTIQHGVRNEDSDDARFSEMPAFGDILEPAQIEQTAHFVLQLGGLDHDAAAATAGAPLFEENCAVCHGEKGEGMTDLGAPRLADAIWLYGGDFESVSNQIRMPSHGVMPAWGQRLDDVTVKELAVYVHGLGGGQ